MITGIFYLFAAYGWASFIVRSFREENFWDDVWNRVFARVGALATLVLLVVLGIERLS